VIPTATRVMKLSISKWLHLAALIGGWIKLRSIALGIRKKLINIRGKFQLLDPGKFQPEPFEMLTLDAVPQP
jgi:hypothetical protein